MHHLQFNLFLLEKISINLTCFVLIHYAGANVSQWDYCLTVLYLLPLWILSSSNFKIVIFNRSMMLAIYHHRLTCTVRLIRLVASQLYKMPARCKKQNGHLKTGSWFLPFWYITIPSSTLDFVMWQLNFWINFFVKLIRLIERISFKIGKKWFYKPFHFRIVLLYNWNLELFRWHQTG